MKGVRKGQKEGTGSYPEEERITDQKAYLFPNGVVDNAQFGSR